MIVTEPRGEIAAWMGLRLGLTFKPPYTTIACVRDGKIRGAMLFHSWTDNDVEITVSADELPKSLLAAAYRYVVDQLGCTRATYRTREDNQAAVHALFRLGGKLEGRLRKYFADDTAALVFGILKEEFRYGKRS